MATHLTGAELVEYADGALTASRAAHVETCARCREAASALTGVLSRAREDAVPEPSPLFWEHLSARVRDALDAEPAPRSGLRLRLPFAAAAAAVVALASALMLTRGIPFRTVVTDPSIAGPSRDERAASPTSATLPGAVEPFDFVLDDDADWALVRVVADGLQWEDAPDAGLHAHPGSAEAVALEMSAAERHELARLMEDEIKRTGA